MEHEAVELLSRYLKINTTNPPGNEAAGVKFFADIFKAEGVEFKTYEADKGRASIRAHISGTGQKEPLILLNHIDVVLAEAEQWSFDPFGGEIKDGFIHGRGTLDMKGLGIMELMALLAIHRDGQRPCRDVIFMAVADEEDGGKNGADFLLKNHPDDFKAGLVLNEGGFGLTDLIPNQKVIFISTSEKGVNWVRVHRKGQPGHGSMPHSDNALERLVLGLKRLIENENPIAITPVIAEYFKRLAGHMDVLKPYAEDHQEKTLIRCLTESGMADIPQVSAMIRNTVSVNVIQAGSKTNVIPSMAEAELDIRLLPGTDPGHFTAGLKQIIGDDQIVIENINSNAASSSPMDTEDFCDIEAVFNQYFPDSIVSPSLLMGASDSRFFREKGITSYGVFPVLVPMADIQRIHGIDEKISVENMTRGTVIMQDIVRKLCSL